MGSGGESGWETPSLAWSSEADSADWREKQIWKKKAEWGAASIWQQRRRTVAWV